jgi:hypothetical protein
MTKTKIVLDDLTDDEAWALAQMCKRMIWDDFRRLSAGRAERDAIHSRARLLGSRLVENSLSLSKCCKHVCI